MLGDGTLMAGTLSVGARLETVQPRPLTDQLDRLFVLILLAVAIVIHSWVVLHTEMTARDSIGFARIAMQLLEPSMARTPQDAPEQVLSPLDVVLRSQHPPGYSVAVLGCSLLLKQIHPVPISELPGQLLLATQLVSATAGVLLVFPMYWLGRMLLGKPQGFAAALLFQFLPTPARVTSDGLTEGLYLLFLGVSLFLAARAIRLRSVKNFLLCGLAVGATYLVRPEGLLVGLVAMIALLQRVWVLAIPRRAGLGLLVALGVGVLLSSGWYMVLIGGITQKPTGTSLLKNFNVRKYLQTQAPAAPRVGLFADWYTPDQYKSRTHWMLNAFAKEGGKVFHFAPLGLAVIGLVIVVFRRLREQPEWLVLILYGIFFTGLLLAMTGLKSYDDLNRPYLSERHLLPLAYIGCIFAIAGLFACRSLFGPDREELGRRIAWIVLGVILISCVPSLLRSLHSSRQGHKEAGLIIRDQAAEEDTVIDPFDYALWYSGRSLKQIKPDPPGKIGTYRWAILESGENHNSATPRLPAAIAVSQDRDNKAELVKWWPTDKPESEAKVRLFKQQIK
jgi:hypothetical protein